MARNDYPVYVSQATSDGYTKIFLIDLTYFGRPFLFVTDDNDSSIRKPAQVFCGLHDVSISLLSDAGADWVIPIILAAQARDDTDGAVKEILRIHGENEAKREALPPKT